jgi:hypothetical protein
MIIIIECSDEAATEVYKLTNELLHKGEEHFSISMSKTLDNAIATHEQVIDLPNS